ncbi:cytochrome P450 [Mycobacterium haemophilum]|uniref:cytochrome P450 n=1 Tax=Mycobacterium haemophilum TaxID=29311 RepID=UPI0009E496E3|nr:cytochrome P450 [Mycobacterium haemophilum]
MTLATATPIPHPCFRLPIVGDLLTTDFAKPAQGLAAEFGKLGSGIVEQRIFGLSIIALADPALIDEVNDETVWEKHIGPVMRKLRLLMGDGLFTADNEEPNWRKAHNILMPAFTKTAMMAYHDTMAATVRELVEFWDTDSAGQSWINIPAQANRLTIEIIARAGLGYSFSKLSDLSDNAFVAAVIRELSYFRLTARTDAIPFYGKLFGQKHHQQHVADNAYIRRQVCDIIEARRRNPTAGPRDDMLDIMLHNTDPDTGEHLDTDNISNQILTLLVAGSETSANAIAFALHYLSIHPDVAARARREVDQRWPDRGIPDVLFGDIAKLRYLRRIVDETLRLWPVAPGYLRKARCGTTLGNGKYSFRQGDWVLVLLPAAHRDRAWGPDAHDFNPDRFLPENLRKLPPYTYKPFGTGPRACIGRQFALHEMVLALAMIVHQFTVEPHPGYQLEVAETMTLKPKNLRLRLHRRR